MHSPVPGQREHNDSKSVGHWLLMLSAIEHLVAPQKASWVFFSSLESGSRAQTISCNTLRAQNHTSFPRVGCPTQAFMRERAREHDAGWQNQWHNWSGWKWQWRCQGYYHIGVAGSSTCLYFVEGQISQSPEAVHIADHLRGGGCVKGRRNVQVFLIPTFGDRLENSVVVFGSTDALHASGHTRRLRSHTESSSLARELNAINMNFQATCTATPKKCKCLSRKNCSVRFGDRSNERRTDRANILKEMSLRTRLCDEVRIRAHACVHPWLASPGPIFKYLSGSLICICRKTGTWVLTHSESCGMVKFPYCIQWDFLWLRERQ